LADILAVVWLVVITLFLFLIPRSTRIRVAEGFGLGIRARLGEPGIRAFLKLKILISAFKRLFVVLIFLFGKRSRVPW
jgi:hypothetical protein